MLWGCFAATGTGELAWKVNSQINLCQSGWSPARHQSKSAKEAFQTQRSCSAKAARCECLIHMFKNWTGGLNLSIFVDKNQNDQSFQTVLFVSFDELNKSTVLCVFSSLWCWVLSSCWYSVLITFTTVTAFQFPLSVHTWTKRIPDRRNMQDRNGARKETRPG